MDRFTSAISKLTQRSASKPTAASTCDPNHQLKNQLLQYGLTSLRKTFRDLDEKQAARWYKSTGKRGDSMFMGKTVSLNILTEILFEKSQEPELKQWNRAIASLKESHGGYEVRPPTSKVEFESDEEF